jgi:signal peptidase
MVTSKQETGGNRWLSPVSIVNVLFIGLVLMSLGVAVLGRVVPITGRMTYVVSGPSMTPALQVGSAIVVEPVDPMTLAVGDVISVRSGPATSIFTHRIVRIIQREGEPWFETKGDANGAADPSIIPSSNVLGRVAVVIPYAGYLVAMGSRPSGMIVVIGVGLMLLISSWLLDSRRSSARAAATS